MMRTYLRMASFILGSTNGLFTENVRNFGNGTIFIDFGFGIASSISFFNSQSPVSILRHTYTHRISERVCDVMLCCPSRRRFVVLGRSAVVVIAR